MIKTTARADAFTEASKICRTRAKELSPGSARSQAEFELMSARIEELETLAFVFDQLAVSARPEAGVDLKALATKEIPEVLSQVKNNGSIH